MGNGFHSSCTQLSNAFKKSTINFVSKNNRIEDFPMAQSLLLIIEGYKASL